MITRIRLFRDNSTYLERLKEIKEERRGETKKDKRKEIKKKKKKENMRRIIDVFDVPWIYKTY